VLEGDIPSAMNPPPGCPFQTRCRWKHMVPGNLCETQVPPMRDLGGGHGSLCWLTDEVLATMEPVIVIDEEGPADVASQPVSHDAPHRAAPAEHQPERPTGVREGDDAEVIDERSEPDRSPSRTDMSEPGDSSPKKTAGETGDGRQATPVPPAKD
jgi:peptide/nickel transport system ATP-binding protein